MTLDTHVHFWRYSAEKFGWIDDDMAGIRRDFGPAQLLPVLRTHHVAGVLAVQARQTTAETDWLCDLAGEHSGIRGVVGWLPLASPQIRQLLEARDRALVGLRHVLQAEPPAFFDDVAFNDGLHTLDREQLTYDLLITEPQLSRAIALVDRHPSLTFVVDHLAKPELKAAPGVMWLQGIGELARRPNVYCKLSGGIVEAKLRWRVTELMPYFDAAIEAFGPGRAMFGSNWPVSEAAGGYGMWISAMRAWAAKLSESEHADLFGRTAMRAYRLRETK